ncbi:sensor histidine kinase [Burkholderia sp. ABCPW 14]|uniref:sensor histidine kinase n=1 Tax=Burkholderia sp. ABCPW 14 TaxID=1637860 RepID=UPI000A76F26E|nr:ATP-binding protein [Burkholderia sp. ABCPW 14]
MTREINQPLTAMATLSESAVRLPRCSDAATAKFNLARIGELVGRIGALRRRLHSLARGSEAPIVPSIDSAVALLGHRLNNGRVDVKTVAPSEPLRAFCGTVRLELVLVNLLQDAIDAMDGTQAPAIEIHAYQDGRRAVIDVLDNGIGFPSVVRTRLFEPFFTTKKAGGLGLAITAAVAASFGDGQMGANWSKDGSQFRSKLRAASLEGAGR